MHRLVWLAAYSWHFVLPSLFSVTQWWVVCIAQFLLHIHALGLFAHKQKDKYPNHVQVGCKK